MNRIVSLFVVVILMVTACSEAETILQSEEKSVENTLPSMSGYNIVSTNQIKFYDNTQEISAPVSGSSFYGQDGNYSKNEPNYQDNGDGTITDLVTGLI